MSFINKESWKCLLGPQAKIIEHPSLYIWKVLKKYHITTDHILTNEEIIFLKNYDSINFHYIDENNFKILKDNFIIKKDKNISIKFNIPLSLTGRKFHDIRNAINKNKNKFIIKDNYDYISDIKIMLNKWSLSLGNKYFRDFSGKNYYYLLNNFHKNNISIFIYDNKDLISFGVLSSPINNKSSYIIGKALCLTYPGLSEFTDIELYKKGIENNISEINLGQATKGLKFFKQKFPNAIEEIHYNGNIRKE